MCTKNDLQLSLSGDTFQAMKTDFDSILARTIGNMEMKGADEATITIKLGISLEKVNSGTYDDAKEVTKPSFKHDISSVMQVKDKKTGSLTGDYELVWDTEEKKYVMRKLGGEQMTMFDDEIVPENDVEEKEDCFYIEAPAEDYVGDTESDEEIISRLKWLALFVGRKFKVVESNSVYTLRTDTNEVVLTSADGMFHIDAEILEEHKDHEIECIGFYSEATETESGSLRSVEFRCKDCYETIFEFPIYGECDEADEDSDFEPDGEEPNDVSEPEDIESLDYEEPDEI